MSQTISINRYDEIREKIEEHIKYYEKALENNKYSFRLANGDNINLTFPRKHIAHLLGVYTDKLKTAGIVNTSSSYDVLKKLANSDLTFIGIKNANKSFNIDSLFSEHIDHKIKIFNEILKVRSDDIYCIIKYISDRTYTTGEEKENSDYFIIRKHENYFSVLGIVKNDEINNYVPVTSRMYDSYEELKEFLAKVAKNQEVTYPVNFQIENYEKEFYTKGFLKLEEKIELNKTLKNVFDNFGAIPSTNRDFIATIERLLNNRQKSNNYNSILSLIRDDIKQRNIIDIEEVKDLLDEDEIPNELRLLIETCNDFICSNYSNNEIVGNSYSSIQNENVNLKKQLETLKQELLKFKEENSELKEKNTILEESNNSSSLKLKVLTDAYKSII